nr:MAG TPA: hypothetical protein [Caudoviricetes sp.]
MFFRHCFSIPPIQLYECLLYSIYAFDKKNKEV